MTARYYIALGSNLTGDSYDSPESVVLSAMDSLDTLGTGRVERSELYRTAPVPVSDQPWYVNAVVGCDSDLLPLAMLAELNRLEAAFGRVRTVRNAPRILDLDIVAIEGRGWEVVDDPALTVPHPRMQDRAFVLDPLSDVAPHWVHPTLKLSVAALRERL